AVKPPAREGYTQAAGRMQEMEQMASQEGIYYFLCDPQAAGGSRQTAFPYTIRSDFPILARKVNGKPLVWLDNAATTQKPQCVIDALSRYYSEYNSNIHRGAHALARQATRAYEDAREKVCRFIGARSKEEIIFVRGATEAINLVAAAWGAANIGAGDEIILTEMEHHSNIVPWQMLAEKTGAFIKTAPINACGELDLYQYEWLFSPRTRIVAAAHVSNVLGTVNPVRSMADIAHRHGALILIDGAQSAPHMPVDVRALDADFFAFSGHKTYGPTGIGVLYGKQELLERMAPYQGGGGMIENVSFSHTSYKRHPERFEAGTGNIADAVGLGAAVDYLQNMGMERVRQHESELTRYLMHEMQKIPGMRLIGTSPGKTSVVSFILDGAEPAAIAEYLDKHGIAIRAGHHCAQPVLRHFGLEGTARASIGMYNTFEEMDMLVKTVSEFAMRF
ncbi:MAG: SufS family cysteine desulfurase, partial [Bacillota bacterium]